MVSSQLTALIENKTFNLKPSKSYLHFPKSPSNETSDSLELELDFSDTFGPLPLPAGNSETPSDDPVIIHNRSHSLVGPTPRVSHLMNLRKLTISETNESSLDLTEDFSDVIDKEEIEEEEEGCENGSKVNKGIGLEDFEVMKVVGKGAFGKVYQVRKRDSLEIYAMKVVRKDKIVEKNHMEYMKAERDILTKIDHPFIVQLRYSFQTKYRLYLVMDFVNGGHLFFQLYHHGLFLEDLARIYAAEIVSAVSHLHANGIMHRDLKPENILLDMEGHALLTDFGLAKEFDENARSNSLCGTVEYMSPEIILGKGHDKAADWWSVGILLFEMLTGETPYNGGNREKVQKKILKDKIKLPPFLSSEAHALLKGLLQKEPSKRLGNGVRGSDEIKNHKWFKPINWKKLDAREIQPSFRPEVSGNQCIANFDKRWTEMPLLDSPASSPNGSSDLFHGFTYVKPAASFLRRHSPAC